MQRTIQLLVGHADRVVAYAAEVVLLLVHYRNPQLFSVFRERRVEHLLVVEVRLRGVVDELGYGVPRRVVKSTVGRDRIQPYPELHGHLSTPFLFCFVPYSRSSSAPSVSLTSW